MASAGPQIGAGADAGSPQLVCHGRLGGGHLSWKPWDLGTLISRVFLGCGTSKSLHVWALLTQRAQWCSREDETFIFGKMRCFWSCVGSAEGKARANPWSGAGLGFCSKIPGWKVQLRGLSGGSGAVSLSDGPSPGNQVLAHG